MFAENFSLTLISNIFLLIKRNRFILVSVGEKSFHVCKFCFKLCKHWFWYLKLYSTGMVLYSQCILTEKLNKHLVRNFVVLLTHLNYHKLLIFFLFYSSLFLITILFLRSVFRRDCPCQGVVLTLGFLRHQICSTDTILIESLVFTYRIWCLVSIFICLTL